MGFLLTVSSCGGSENSNSVPTIEFDVDTKNLTPPKDSQGQEDSRLDGEEGGKDVLGDGLDDLGDLDSAGADIEADGVDIELDLPIDLPVICEAGEVACDKGSVVSCTADGTVFQVVDDCDDQNDCTDDWCYEGACTHEINNPNCCQPSCDIGEMCVEGECVCAPLCLGKNCGPNGCGGDCGECDEGYECSSQGVCTCIPVCEGLICGDDSCGGSCGECAEHHECVEGACVCVPDCEGKNCGTDGCGGICGTCEGVMECSAGTCQFLCSGCPQLNGCQRVLYGSHAYYLCSEARKWDKAESFCKDSGTYFVTMNDQGENDFLKSQISGTMWIGLWQNWLGEWKWSNDEGVNFTFWDDGQPDNGGFLGGEDCTQLKANGRWNDDQCKGSFPFICEFNP